MERGVKMAQNNLKLATGATADYIVGGGNLYFYPVDIVNPPTTFPTDIEIEQDCYNVGVCSGGFKIKGKPKIVEITDSDGNIIRNFMTQNKITIATGFTQWNLSNYQLLCGATLYEIANDGSNSVYGAENNDSMVVMQGQGILPTYLVRLVNKSLPNGQVVRFTTFAQPTEGFTSNFDDKPNEIDATMTSILFVEDFMASIRQSAGTTGKVNTTGSSSSNNNINNTPSSPSSQPTVTNPSNNPKSAGAPSTPTVNNNTGNTNTNNNSNNNSNNTNSNNTNSTNSNNSSSTNSSSNSNSSNSSGTSKTTASNTTSNTQPTTNPTNTPTHASLNAVTQALKNNGYNGQVMVTNV